MFDEPSVDPLLREAVHDFLDSIDGFLDLLLNLRDLPEGEQYQDDKTVCTLRLLNFIRRIGGRDAMCTSPFSSDLSSFLADLRPLIPQTSNTSTSSSTLMSEEVTTPKLDSRSRCTRLYTTGRAPRRSNLSHTEISSCQDSPPSLEKRRSCSRRWTTSVRSFLLCHIY